MWFFVFLNFQFVNNVLSMSYNLNFFVFCFSTCRFAVILAFDVRIEREAQELADSLNIKIFHANIIYHLFDMFVKYRSDLKEKNREMYKHAAVFPCKLKILPQFIFNSRDPIVVGVSIEAGVLKEGTPLCVPSKDVSITLYISSNCCLSGFE